MPELLLKEYDLYLGDERFVTLHIALVYLLQQLNPISTHLLETVVVVVKAVQFFCNYNIIQMNSTRGPIQHRREGQYLFTLLRM